MLLFLSSWRHLLRHPWQFGLSVLGVALGVSVVLAIDLTNASALRSFELSVESVSGRATHQILGSSGNLPESLYAQLRRDHGFRQTAPALEGYVGLPLRPGQAFQLLGVDPFAEAPFRSYLRQLSTDSTGAFTEFLTRPDALVMSAATARELSLEVGDPLEVRIGSRVETLRLVGTITLEDEFSRLALKNLLITDISAAQRLLEMPGVLSRVDVLIEGPAALEHVKRLQKVLPEGVQLEPVASRVESGAKMTEAFQINLTALSLLALVVGMFLIYNTMTFSVVQRYALLGRLRAVGVTRQQVFRLVLGEAVIVGLLGTLLGLVGGIGLSQELVRLVTQTINDLYFVLNVNAVELSPWSLSKGIGLGMGATLLVVLPPALEASGISPRTVLMRSATEESHRRLQQYAALGGTVLFLVGVGVLQVPTTDLLVSYFGLFSLLIGAALVTPACTGWVMSGLRPLVQQVFGVFGALGVRGVQAELSRTGVAIAALMIAVASSIGLQVMVGSFRNTVYQWLGSQLWADIYVSPPSLVANRSDQFLEDELIEALAQTPGVQHVTRLRGLDVEVDFGKLRLIAMNLPEEGYASYRFKESLDGTPWKGFTEKSHLVISEPLAFRTGLQPGDTLELKTPAGPQGFLITGIFHDYASERGFGIISRTRYEQFWDDPRSNSAAYYLQPGQDADQALEAMGATLNRLGRTANAENQGIQDLVIRSNVQLREQSLAIFDRTFAITGVLQLLVAGVAFIGVLSALMALQLERQRELGVMRATGITPGQLWGLITGQCSLMGLVAGVLAMPVGVMLAVVLIYVVNQRSFGWTFPTVVSGGTLLQGLLIAVGAAVLAGLYPAWKMSRTPPALALREE